MTVPEQIRAAVERLRLAVDRDSRAEIEQEIATITRILPIQHDKASNLRTSAAILFSPQRHSRYGGVAEVKQDILRTCASLMLIANQIEAAERGNG